MSAKHHCDWELVREFGLEYGESAVPSFPIELVWPTVAEHLPGAGYLIVDEHPIFTNPPGQDCRTLLLSESLDLVFNSKDHGIQGAYGCAMDGARFAVLGRVRQEIHIYTADGSLVRKFSVPRFVQHGVRMISWTQNDSFLVGCSNKGKTFDFAELDIYGRILWSLVGSGANAGLLASLQLLPNDAILVANESRHVIQEIKRNGTVLIRFGQLDHPSAAPGCLFNPKSARQLDDGTLLIAGGHNHQCLSVDGSGQSKPILPRDQALFVPSCITKTGTGNLLVCDVGLKTILELENGGSEAWRLGGVRVRKRHLSFPRSVEPTVNGHLLVADTAHNRILEMNGTSIRTIPVLGTPALFWPRSARRTESGTILAADGRNSRVVEIGVDGRILRELREVRHLGKRIALEDPHDARALPNDQLLVTDSSRNIVIKTDWDGNADCIVGLEDLSLNDPHSAQFLADGRIAIADSGNHRLVFVDARSGANRNMSGLLSSRVDSSFNYPRHAQFADDGSALIVDSHNSRVVAIDAEGALLWELKHVPNSPLPRLAAPRWAMLVHTNDLLVADHFNHRILHLRRHAPAA